MPRKTVYTTELGVEISNYISAGCTNRYAISLAGVGKTTFYKWLTDAPQNPLSEFQKTEFRDSMSMARVRRRYILISRIIKASETDWRAAAWYLERTYPEVYGSKNHATKLFK